MTAPRDGSDEKAPPPDGAETAAPKPPAQSDHERDPVPVPAVSRQVQALRRVGRVLHQLPLRVRRALAGKPVPRRGAVPDPVVSALLNLGKRLASKPVYKLSVYEARLALEVDTRILEPDPAPIAGAWALRVAGGDGPLPARLYKPTSTQLLRSPPPLLVYFHGGGFVVGSLDSHDAVCRELCARSGCAVLSVEYRLAPEHPFPAPVRDAVSAYRDAAARASSWGCDPARLAVGGDSAGGNLAALVSLALKREPIAPKLQLLIYPALDLTMQNPSIDEYAEGYLLERASLHWYLDRYMPDRTLRADPSASPLHTREADLAGAPPVHLQTAGFDALQDEATRYAAKLRAAGVPVEHKHYAGLVHGYLHMALVVDAAREAFSDAAKALRAALA